MTSLFLKIIGCVTMVIDHSAVFFPSMHLAMNWIGRLSLPLFLFCCGWSCVYTRDIRKYVFRLYAASVIMLVFQFALNINYNIFTTLFHTALLIMILSLHDRRSRIIGISAYLIWQTCTSMLLVVASSLLQMNVAFEIILSTLTGNQYSIDGGYYYVILGVVLWALRDRKVALSIGFSALTAVFFICSNFGAYISAALPSNIVPVADFIVGRLGIGLSTFSDSRFSPLAVNYQWMMIISLPFMLLYNGRRGRPVKWFFYIFYPVHLTVIRLLMMALHISYGA